MKTSLNLLVVMVLLCTFGGCWGCGDSKTEKTADVKKSGVSATANVNDPAMEALAQANTSGNDSVSVKIQIDKGDKYAEAAIVRELGSLKSGASVTLSDGKTMSISRTVSAKTPAVPQATPPTQTVKVEVVASGSIPVTGNGNIPVTGSGAVNVKGSGNIPVTGSGTVEVKAVSTGTTFTAEGKSFELWKDQCGGLYYKGTDGQLHPIKL